MAKLPNRESDVGSRHTLVCVYCGKASANTPHKSIAGLSAEKNKDNRTVPLHLQISGFLLVCQSKTQVGTGQGGVPCRDSERNSHLVALGRVSWKTLNRVGKVAKEAV